VLYNVTWGVEKLALFYTSFIHYYLVDKKNTKSQLTSPSPLLIEQKTMIFVKVLDCQFYV